MNKVVDVSSSGNSGTCDATTCCEATGTCDTVDCSGLSTSAVNMGTCVSRSGTVAPVMLPPAVNHELLMIPLIAAVCLRILCTRALVYLALGTGAPAMLPPAVRH